MKRVATGVVAARAGRRRRGRRLGRRRLGQADRHRATKVTKLTIWVGWSAGHELMEFKKVVAEYDAEAPGRRA